LVGADPLWRRSLAPASYLAHHVNIYDTLIERYGPPPEQYEDERCTGRFWCVSERICVMCGGGKVGAEGTRWTIDVHETVRRPWAARGHGIFILWDFTDLTGYETAARQGVADWIQRNRNTINRAVIYSTNPFVRMGVNMVNMLFNNNASAPSTPEAFVAQLDGFVGYLTSKAGTTR
jgi:hypothetical protein